MGEPKPFDAEAFTADARRNWDEAAPHYQTISSTYFQPITERFAGFCALEPGQRALDLACGPGTLTTHAAKLVAPGGSVVGVDLAPSMIRLAEQRTRGLAGVTLRVMNAEALDLPDGSFDAALCQLGLMLFARPERALAEIARVLRPRGAAACLVQGRPERMLWTALINRALLAHAPELKTEGAPSLYAYGPEGALESALEAAGLSVRESKRLEGSFAFDSAEEYWQLMTAGAGRTGAALRSLPSQTREAVRSQVFGELSKLRFKDGIAIPYEFVMARGVKA